MELKIVVGNMSSYLSADPGVVTYLEGPLHTQQPPHWAVRSAAAIALLFKVPLIFSLYPASESESISWDVWFLSPV